MQIKFFKKERNFKKEKKSLRSSINLYWKLSICLMFLVILAASFFGFYFFTQLDQEPILKVGDDSNQVVTAKKERIDKVLEYFSIRENKSIEIFNSPAPVIDPSL